MALFPYERMILGIALGVAVAVAALIGYPAYKMGQKAERAKWEDTERILGKVRSPDRDGSWQTVRGEYVPCPEFRYIDGSDKEFREKLPTIPPSPRLSVEPDGSEVYLVAHDHQWRVGIGANGKLRIQRYIHGYQMPPHEEDITAGVQPEENQ